jgi:hypothetical protein
MQPQFEMLRNVFRTNGENIVDVNNRDKSWFRLVGYLYLVHQLVLFWN